MFNIYFPNYEKFLRKHLLPIIKYIFTRNSYVCPIWIFLFNSDQAQSNSEQSKGEEESAEKMKGDMKEIEDW